VHKSNYQPFFFKVNYSFKVWSQHIYCWSAIFCGWTIAWCIPMAKNCPMQILHQVLRTLTNKLVVPTDDLV